MGKSEARYQVAIVRDDSLSHVDEQWVKHAKRFTNPNVRVEIKRVGPEQ